MAHRLSASFVRNAGQSMETNLADRRRIQSWIPSIKTTCPTRIAPGKSSTHSWDGSSAFRCRSSSSCCSSAAAISNRRQGGTPRVFDGRGDQESTTPSSKPQGVPPKIAPQRTQPDPRDSMPLAVEKMKSVRWQFQFRPCHGAWHSQAPPCPSERTARCLLSPRT